MTKVRKKTEAGVYPSEHDEASLSQLKLARYIDFDYGF